MMGRWRSGAPLALCPLHDDPALGADPLRNNNFLFREDDPDGFKTPFGSHIRRTNPRDAKIAGMVRTQNDTTRSRLRPAASRGRLEDDGVERG